MGIVVAGSFNQIGGTASGAANRIAFNTGAGVLVAGLRNSIRGNAVWGNNDLGIDLYDGALGVTPNDPQDADAGANNLQNFPVITGVNPGVGSVTITGTLNSTPNATFAIDFYRSAAADPSGYGQGEVYLGSRTVTTSATGDAGFSIFFPIAGNIAGQYFTATASRLYGGAVYETSEFSQAVPTGQFGARFNFQPALSPVPAGYIRDTGAVYGTRNGYSYGWNGDNTANTRDRNAPNSPDQRYDTLIHLQKDGGNFSWELAVPNGVYHVRLVAGDPSFFDSVYKINVEGVLAVDATPNAGALWFERTVDVTVNDGRLTISNAPGSVNNKVCFVEITGS